MYSKSPTIKHIDSPLKLKLSSAITPSIGDSDFLHLESQNKLKPQSCDQPFDENVILKFLITIFTRNFHRNTEKALELSRRQVMNSNCLQ